MKMIPSNTTNEKFQPSKVKLKELFLLWLSLTSTRLQIEDYFIKKENELQTSSEAFTPIFEEPLPKTKTIRKKRKHFPSKPLIDLTLFEDPKTDIKEIPSFFKPLNSMEKEKEIDESILENDTEIQKLKDLFSVNGEICPMDKERFRVVTTSVFGLPVYLTTTVFEKIVFLFEKTKIEKKEKEEKEGKKKGKKVTVSYENTKLVYVKYFRGRSIKRKVFNAFLENFEGESLKAKDFKNLLIDIIENHPGLAFLKDSPFKEKYAETVIIRIFYNLDPKCENEIKFSKQFDIKRNSFVDSLFFLSTTDDMNKDLNYFSYEHFYVLYCKFWELDEDRDFLLSKDDLLKYSNFSLTDKIVDRIIECGGGKRSTSKKKCLITYEDFVWFCISEEDKTSITAQRYWFKCIDFDDNGFITPFEMKFFFEDQVNRMKMLTNEEIKFDDLYVQMLDMIMPMSNNKITMDDIERSNCQSVFYDILFNLNKFLMFEQRGFSVLRNKFNLNPWSYFCRITYDVMAAADQESNDDE